MREREEGGGGEKGGKGQSFLLFISHRASNLPVKETDASGIQSVKSSNPCVTNVDSLRVSNQSKSIMIWIAFLKMYLIYSINANIANTILITQCFSMVIRHLTVYQSFH